jgi:hypothetical protein
VKHTTSILLLLIAAVMLIPVSAARAQTPVPPTSNTAVEMVVIPAFEGVFKYGEWLPLSVELTNSGGDLEAEVRVRVPRASGGLTFSQPVSLPAGAHKLLTLYILPNNFSHSLEVELASGADVLTTEKAEMKPMMNVNVIIGLVSRERGALALLNGLQYPASNRPVQVVDVDLWQLPERIEGLRSFDVLIFNDIDTSKLTPEQIASLTAWVQSGGKLVLGGGAGAELTLAGLPAGLLPVKLEGRENLTAEDLNGLAEFADGQKIQAGGEFIVNKTSLMAGSVLTGAEGPALVSELSYGQGQVDFVALDLSAAPFEGWSSSTRFWEKLLRTAEDFFNQPTDISQRTMRANMMISPLTMIPSMELPSIKWLAVILGIYILIVGPANYLILKRKNRLHLAWVTIPALTLLFSGAAFGGGYLMKGNDILIHKLGVVEIQPGGSALVTTYMGLFSPSQRFYEVEVPAGSLLSPIVEEYMPATGSGPGSELTIQQGRPTVLKGLSVDQWAMQSFMTEETLQDYGRISGHLVIKNGKLVGKVRNGLKSTLMDTTLILQNSYTRIGDLLPGQEKEITFDVTPSLTMRGMDVYYRMYEETAAELTTNERALLDLKRSILSSTFDNQMMSKLSSRAVAVGGGGGGGVESSDTVTADQSVLIFGWVDELPPDVEVASEEASVQTMGMVFDYIDYELPLEGEITFPPGILQGRIVESDAGMCGPMSSVSMYFDRDMEGTVAYQLPNPRLYDFSQIDLRLENDGGMGSTLPDVAVYDWQAQKYVNFPKVAFGTNTIKNPERFISENGDVQVHFQTAPEFQMGSCLFVEMGFKGEGKGGSK